MNPATAFATTFVDELVRCGLREAVLAPGSRSAPLAMALWQRCAAGDSGGPAPRLHVRIDERSAAFLALGLAKAGGRPVVVVCTSGTASANFHPAVIEASEAGVPLLVITADRPPELRGTGANQTIDQLKLYGDAVRWFCAAGVPEARPGMNGYWRSLACRAWAAAAGQAGGRPGPVHVNVPLRDPLVPDLPDPVLGERGWPEARDGRPGGAPWTRLASWASPDAGTLELPWTERGVILCGDGAADPAALLDLAAEAGWPVLAEPSSGARQGPHALTAYQQLLAHPEFAAGHRPDLVVCAGRPGLSRAQLGFLRGSAGQARQVMLAAGPGWWADPARTGTDVAARLRLSGAPGSPDGSRAWLAAWQRADAVARCAMDAILDGESGLAGPALTEPRLTEPRLARDLAAALPDGALLWAASSLPIRDLDQHMVPRLGLRVLASRGASGIDGLTSTAIGAALAHQAAGGGPAAALLGDLALLHDAPGLFTGPDEARPDLVLVVVNNDGGGIFSTLEPAATPGPFERVFGTPHGADLARLAAAAGIPYLRLHDPAELPAVLAGGTATGLAEAGLARPEPAGRGLRITELRTNRANGADLRRRLAEAAASGITRMCQQAGNGG